MYTCLQKNVFVYSNQKSRPVKTMIDVSGLFVCGDSV